MAHREMEEAKREKARRQTKEGDQNGHQRGQRREERQNQKRPTSQIRKLRTFFSFRNIIKQTFLVNRGF